MTVNKIKVDSFGSLRDREFTFSDSLNIIEGANESGKTAAAMFIKFMFYGAFRAQQRRFPDLGAKEIRELGYGLRRGRAVSHRG